MRHDLPDVYDDRPLRGPRPPRRAWPWVLLVIAVAAAAAAWYAAHRPPASSSPAAPPPPVRVVRDRPGGKVDQAEAALLLRRHFAPRVAEHCLATIMNGAAGRIYRFTVVNSCDRTRLGRWEVDVAAKRVSPAGR
jgi:hypothetical protein